MIGKKRTVSLVLLAFAALGAQAARAGSLDVGAQPAVVTAEDEANHVFTQQATDGAKTTVTCTTAKFEGTVQGQTDVTEGTVTATYSGCKFAVFFNAQVVMNGCKYTVTGQSEGSSPALTFWIDVAGCTIGKHIELRVAGSICTLTIDEQDTLAHITFVNDAGPPKNFTHLTATVTGIETTQDGGSCPDGDNHHAKDSSLTGTTTVKAFQDSGQEQVTLHEHQYNEHLCGSQVDLTAT